MCHTGEETLKNYNLTSRTNHFNPHHDNKENKEMSTIGQDKRTIRKGNFHNTKTSIRSLKRTYEPTKLIIILHNQQSSHDCTKGVFNIEKKQIR